PELRRIVRARADESRRGAPHDRGHRAASVREGIPPRPREPVVGKRAQAAARLLAQADGRALRHLRPVRAAPSRGAPRQAGAADGEILAKGPNVMRGYSNKPEATREAIDSDGWFHTGDIGELDGEGYLKITDRKKDLIKTAGGKYVAPQPIENRVKLNKFVANAVVLGDRRKFQIILVVPNYDQLELWARERKLAYRSRVELIALPDVQAKVEREV